MIPSTQTNLPVIRNRQRNKQDAVKQEIDKVQKLIPKLNDKVRQFGSTNYNCPLDIFIESSKL